MIATKAVIQKFEQLVFTRSICYVFKVLLFTIIPGHVDRQEDC